MELTLFADVISYSKVIHDNNNSVSHLQSVIDLIYKWSVQNHLSFNVEKYKFMIFTNMCKNPLSESPPTLKLGDHVLVVQECTSSNTLVCYYQMT